MQLHIEKERNDCWQQTYKNVTFSDYSSFMESLSIAGVIPSDYSRSKVNGIHCWNTDPVLLTTTHHPLIEEGYAGTMVVQGSKEMLQVFHSIISKHILCEKRVQPSEVKVETKYHDELNPAIWTTRKTIKPDIKKKMLNIAKAFFEFVDLPELEIEDIVLTGSSANYNWNAHSDIDIHLVVDMAKAEKQFGPVVLKYLDCIRHQWGALHSIAIEDIAVELYVQDSKATHNSTGIYSVQEAEWLIEPKHEPPSIDAQKVKRKTAEYMNQIDKLVTSNKASAVEELFDKLKDMRQASLDKDGEFSTGNLVFKTLRNNGYIEKLVQCKHNAFDRQLSIEDEEFSSLL